MNSRSGVGLCKIVFTVIKTVLGKAVQDNVVPVRQRGQIGLTGVVPRCPLASWQQWEAPRPLRTLPELLSGLSSGLLSENKNKEAGLLYDLKENLKIKCPTMKYIDGSQLNVFITLEFLLLSSLKPFNLPSLWVLDVLKLPLTMK